MIPEIRTVSSSTEKPSGSIAGPEPLTFFSAPSETVSRSDQPISIYPFGLNHMQLNTIVHSLRLPVRVVRSVQDADMILTSQSQMKHKAKIDQLVGGRGIGLHVLRRNTAQNIERFFRSYFDVSESIEALEEDSVREAHTIAKRVQSEGRTLELMPRNSYLRRVQHGVIESYGLNSTSVGEEPNRRLRVFPKAV